RLDTSILDIEAALGVLPTSTPLASLAGLPKAGCTEVFIVGPCITLRATGPGKERALRPRWRSARGRAAQAPPPTLGGANHRKPKSHRCRSSPEETRWARSDHGSRSGCRNW